MIRRSRRELAHAARVREVGLGEPVLVAAQRVEVREVREQRPEEVGEQRNPVLRQPDDAAVDGLAAGRGVELELELADAQREPRIEREIGHRPILALGSAGVPARELADHPRELAEPDQGGPGAEPRDPRVVGLTRGVHRLRDITRSRLAEQRDAAHVVDVPLRGDHVGRRPGMDRVEQVLVVRRLPAHARVHDHAARVRCDHVARARSRRAVDEVADPVRALVVGEG